MAPKDLRSFTRRLEEDPLLMPESSAPPSRAPTSPFQHTPFGTNLVGPVGRGDRLPERGYFQHTLFGTNLVGSVCSQCGRSNRPQAKFCAYCGVSLRQPEPVDPNHDESAFESLVSFHRTCIREYAELWFDAIQRAEEGITAGDAAYHLCLHGTMLRRYTGEPAATAGLVELPAGERTSLLNAVGVYLRELILAPAAESILAEDVIEPEDLERLEDMLILRIGVEEVLLLRAN